MIQGSSKEAREGSDSSSNFECFTKWVSVQDDASMSNCMKEERVVEKKKRSRLHVC